jgi:hypothetical protein
MARIFISHSSVNNAEAIALRDWLAGEGWDDVFSISTPNAASSRASAGSAPSTRRQTAARQFFS